MITLNYIVSTSALQVLSLPGPVAAIVYDELPGLVGERFLERAFACDAERVPLSPSFPFLGRFHRLANDFTACSKDVDI